jgi:hypothetical protein
MYPTRLTQTKTWQTCMNSGRHAKTHGHTDADADADADAQTQTRIRTHRDARVRVCVHTNTNAHRHTHRSRDQTSHVTRQVIPIDSRLACVCRKRETRSAAVRPQAFSLLSCAGIGCWTWMVLSESAGVFVRIRLSGPAYLGDLEPPPPIPCPLPRTKPRHAASCTLPLSSDHATW